MQNDFYENSNRWDADTYGHAREMPGNAIATTKGNATIRTVHFKEIIVIGIIKGVEIAPYLTNKVAMGIITMAIGIILITNGIIL